DLRERTDHREKAIRVVLDAEPDPAAEPGDVDVDEPHRPGERGDPIRDSVLDALRSLFGLPDERRVRLEPGVREPSEVDAGATRRRRAGRRLLHPRRRLLSRFGRRGRHASRRLATPAWTISAPMHIATSALTRAGSIVCISLSSL